MKKWVVTAAPVGTGFLENTLLDQPFGIFGSVERISVSATGTDTAFTVSLKDENLVTIFTATDFNSVSLPTSYAVSQADTAGTNFLGVPVGGALICTGESIDDVNMTEVVVTVYYSEQPE